MIEELNSENLGGRARTAIGWKLLSQCLTTGLQMLTVIVLSRLLMPQDFGILGMATMVTGLAGIFRDLGLGQALVQRKSIEAIHLSSAYWGTTLMGALLTVLTIALAPMIGGFFKEPRMVPVLQVISLTFLISPFATIPNSMLQRALDFKRPFYAGLVSAIVYAVVGLTMALQGYSYWSLVYALLASTLANSVVMCVLTRHLPPLIPCFRGIRDLYSFGVGQTGVSVFNYIAQQADYFVIGHWLDSAALGLYTRAFTTTHQPLSLIASVLSSVLFPLFAHLREAPAQARATMGRILMIVSMFTFPLLALFGVIAPELIPLLFGKQWQAAVLPTQILAFAGMLRTLINPSATLPKAFGAIYAQVWLNAVYCVALAALAIIGTRWGIVGVAWGVLLATCVVWALNARLLYTCSGFGAGHYVRSLRGALLSTVLVYVVTVPVRALAVAWHLPPPAILAATVVLGLSVMLVLTVYSPFADYRATARSLRSALNTTTAPTPAEAEHV